MLREPLPHLHAPLVKIQGVEFDQQVLLDALQCTLKDTKSLPVDQ